MAPRRSAATEVEEEEEEPRLVNLQFNERLSWRAGKAISTAELLRSLETLFTEMRGMDQGEVNTESLAKVAAELGGKNLIGHKDKGVRAFTACCLVDILKICAPDAPFKPTQLKDIFTFFITAILPALSDPSDAYNAQHTYVLTSLAEVKSIVLLVDVPTPDDLIAHLFQLLFDIVSGTSKASTGEQVSKNVEYHMNGLLVTLVDEAPNLHTTVVDIIMAQFLRAALPGGRKTKANGDMLADGKQSTLLLKELPAAYKMAEFICNACTEKMARYISQYFNEVIIEVSEMTGKDSKPNDRRKSEVNLDSDDEERNAAEDLRELSKAHRLLRELWRASPSVLQNVLPQLEAELSAENSALRLLATETLGDIISGIGAAGPPLPPVMDPTMYPPLKLAETPDSPPFKNVLTTPMSPQSFAQTHPSVYHNFIGRKNDKSPEIRLAWTTAIGRILTTSAGGIGIGREDEVVLVNGLAEKLNDADDKVRTAAIVAVGTFSFRDVVTKLGISGDVGKSGSVMCSLADRARDKKHSVRVEGMTVISRIWGVAAGEILAGNETVSSMLGAIPTKVFDTFYANSKDVNNLLDHVMFEQLIPLSYPPIKTKGSKQANGDSQMMQTNGGERLDADRLRTERILVMIRSLDGKSKKAFFAMQNRQKAYRDALSVFLKYCEEFNGGTTDGDESNIKKQLTQVITWFSNFFIDQAKVAQDLWSYVMWHDRRSYQLIRYAIALESDFKTAFNAIKEFTKRIETQPKTPLGAMETLTTLIYRGGSLVYNRSHLPAILDFSRNDTHGLGATAHEVLNEISKSNPYILKAQVKELCKLLQEQSPTQTKTNDHGSVETLKACAAYARKYPDEIARDRKFTQALVSFAQYGAPPKAAKYAVAILMAATDRKEMHARDLLQKSTKDWKYGSDHFLTKLAAISQLMLLEPNAVDDATNDIIIDITTQHLMLKVRTPAEDGDKTWQDESDLDEELQAKCWALKILVNQLRSIDDPERMKTSAQPVLKLLNAIVHKEGDISKEQSTPIHHKSRLRLVAANLILKLCTNNALEALLTPVAFNNLALVAQHSVFQVRRGFVEKIKKYLVEDKLSHRFYAIPFLVAFEPDDQFRIDTITWIRSRAKIFHDRKNQTMAAILPRLLSLLAHHPDYSSDANDLVDTARYILFYVSSVATEGNINLIFRQAERVKQVCDAIKPAESQNLYVLSDLAQTVIRKWQEKRGWNMQSYPGKVPLSKDLFAAMPSHATAQEVAEKQYLPEQMDDLLSTLIKANDKKQKRKSDDNADAPHAKKQRSASTKKVQSKETATEKSKSKASTRTSKKTKSSSSLPAESSPAERRRSGRGTGAKSYADRDDKEDEREMMEGVSRWRYSDDDSDADMKDDSPDVEEGDEESEQEAGEPEEEAEEGEPEAEATSTPTPPKVNGKSPGKKTVPLRAKTVPQSKSKAVPKATSKIKPKAKAATTSKGKGKAPVKNIYDFDDDDDD